VSGTTRRTSGEDWTEWCPRGVLERVQAASHGREVKRNNGSSLSVRKGVKTVLSKRRMVDSKLAPQNGSRMLFMSLYKYTVSETFSRGHL
jgi:hypothetical protein